MIIYGSRMHGKHNEITGWGTCESCGEYGLLKNYSARKWGHLYFVPVLPMGGPVRVIKECHSCDQGMHIPEDNVSTMLDEIRETADKAFSALSEGNREMTDEDGETAHCGSTLASAAETMCCLTGPAEAHRTFDKLEELGHICEHHMVQGVLREFAGEHERALASYQEAAEAAPHDVVPLQFMGELQVNLQQWQAACKTFTQARELDPEDAGVMHSLAEVHLQLEEHGEAVELIEELFRKVPELKNEKKFVKVYKKACKSAGRNPVV